MNVTYNNESYKLIDSGVGTLITNDSKEISIDMCLIEDSEGIQEWINTELITFHIGVTHAKERKEELH